MKRQKDEDGRWAKKHGKSYYGCKHHVNIDQENKLICRYAVTDASVHESQVFEGVLDKDSTGRSSWANYVYRSEVKEEQLQAQAFESRVHRRPNWHQPLTQQEQAASYRRSKVRARVEHVFGYQCARQGNSLVRTTSKVRAAVKIGLINIFYTVWRFDFLFRHQTVQSTGW